METKTIGVVNGQEIQIGIVSLCLVPIKPICRALGVNYASQINKIKRDPFFSGECQLCRTTAADNKNRLMVCLPLKYIYGWLLAISPRNMKEGARERVDKCRKDCYDLLFSLMENNYTKI